VVNGERRRAPGEAALSRREGDRHVTPKRVLYSNLGCCIGTTKKSEAYEISGAVELRKFLYANLLILKAYLRHGCHEIAEKSSKVVSLGAPLF